MIKSDKDAVAHAMDFDDQEAPGTDANGSAATRVAPVAIILSTLSAWLSGADAAERSRSRFPFS